MWVAAAFAANAALHASAEPVSLPTLPDADRISVQGQGVRMGSYLFRPLQTHGPAPGVLLVHGWGGNALDHLEEARRLRDELGAVALAITMRGFEGADGEDDCGAGQSADAVAALDWLGTQPGVDPERLAIVGFSQGGQVALLAAARSSRVRSVVAHYPVTDVARWKVTTAYPQIPGYIEETCEPQGLQAVSPVFHAADIGGPVLLVHGTRDDRVPLEQSRRMHAQLLEARRSSSLIVMPGATHRFTLAQARMAFTATREHLRRTLGLP